MSSRTVALMLLAVFATGIGTGFLFGANAAKEEKPMLFELRTYTTNEGKLPDLHARFRDHTVSLFKKHGMKNVGYWVPTDKENTLIYIVAHKDQAAASASWKAFSKDPDWHAARDKSEENGPILIKGGVKRQYMTPTDYSAMK